MKTPQYCIQYFSYWQFFYHLKILLNDKNISVTQKEKKTLSKLQFSDDNIHLVKVTKVIVMVTRK